MSIINNQITTGNKFETPIRSGLESSRSVESIGGNYRRILFWVDAGNGWW